MAANFDKASTHYDDVAVLQRSVSERLIGRLDLVRLTPGRILDIGSGTGTAGRLLTKKYRRSKLIQLDISHAMLEFSRRTGPRLFSRHAYLQGDAECLPLADNCIDVVFSNLTQQWCNDTDRFFYEIKRVLKPDGYLIFSTFGPSTLNELRSCWGEVDGFTHINTFIDMHDIGDAMVRNGFEGVVMDTEDFCLTYQSGMDLMRELKQLGAQNCNLNRNRGLTGKNKIKQVLSAYENFRENEKLPASFEVIYGHAWKTEQKKSVKGNKESTESYIPVSSILKRKQ